MQRYFHRRRGRLKYPALLIAAALTAFLAVKLPQHWRQPRLDTEKIAAESILKEKTFGGKPVEVKTSSGLKAWLIEDHSNPILSISFIFDGAGRAYEGENSQGLANIAAEVLVYGAGEYDRVRFQEELELNGIYISFTARRDDMAGFMQTPSENRQTAYKLLRLALTEPHFAAEDAAIAKSQLLEALKMQQEQPYDILNLAFLRELFGSHPFGRNPLGRAENIDEITPAALQSFVKDNFARSNLIIGMAGDITPEEAGRAVDEIFGGLPVEASRRELPSPQINVKPRNVHIAKDAAQTVSTFAAVGAARQDSDFYPLYVANYIFGGSGLTSRLSLRAREKEGLTYGVYTSLLADEKTPLITGQFAVTPENYPAMRKILTEEWQKFAREGVSAEELEAARSYLLASYNLRFNSVLGLSEMLAEMQKQKLGLDFLQKRNDYIRNVSLENVNRAAAKYFSRLPVEISLGVSPITAKPLQ